MAFSPASLRQGARIAACKARGATTATSRRYRVEVLGDRVSFYIDSILVATHFRGMPGPGDLLTSTVRVANGTTPASSACGQLALVHPAIWPCAMSPIPP